MDARLEQAEEEIEKTEERSQENEPLEEDDGLEENMSDESEEDLMAIEKVVEWTVVYKPDNFRTNYQSLFTSEQVISI